MHAADISRRELITVWYEGDPAMRVAVAAPYLAQTGNASTAVVYFEIEPGHYLGTHTDSAEEILLLLSGRVEASLSDERGPLAAGQAAPIPARFGRHGEVDLRPAAAAVRRAERRYPTGRGQGLIRHPAGAVDKPHIRPYAHDRGFSRRSQQDHGGFISASV